MVISKLKKLYRKNFCYNSPTRKHRSDKTKIFIRFSGHRLLHRYEIALSALYPSPSMLPCYQRTISKNLKSLTSSIPSSYMILHAFVLPALTPHDFALLSLFSHLLQHHNLTFTNVYTFNTPFPYPVN